MQLTSRLRLSLTSLAILPATTLAMACAGGAAEPAPATAPPATVATVAPSAAPTVPAFTETTKFEVEVGVPPAAGWRWVLGEIRAGAEAVSEPTTDHADPWLLYTLAESHEISLAGKSETLSAGMALWLPPRQQHGHRMTPRARVIVLQLKDRPPERAHGSTVVLVSDKPLDLRAGTAAKLRVREVTLTSGATLPEGAATEHCAAYVVEGAITSRVAGVEQQVAAGSAIEWRPGVPHDARNTGPALARLVLFDVRQ